MDILWGRLTRAVSQMANQDDKISELGWELAIAISPRHWKISSQL